MRVKHYEQYEVLSKGLTLSCILWQRFKRRPEGVFEAALDANPDASKSVHLPLGFKVKIPIPDETPDQETRFDLW